MAAEVTSLKWKASLPNPDRAVLFITTNPIGAEVRYTYADGKTGRWKSTAEPFGLAVAFDTYPPPLTIKASLSGRETREDVWSKADIGGNEWNLHIWLPPEPEPPPPPEFPKDITRAPYTFTANNAEEETQFNDFLGIKPAGDDLDTYLSKLEIIGLEQWKAYWLDIFGAFGRTDMLTFIANRFEWHKANLEEPPEPPPEETIFDKIVKALIAAGTFIYEVGKGPVERISELITGKKTTFTESVKETAEMAADFLALNALSKLFFGQNLKGEAEEFGTATDWLDLALLAAAIVPVAKVAETGAKIALAKISTTEAAALTAKLGDAAVINRLLKIVKAHPETSARFLSKFPIAVREAVINGLYKTAAGRIAVVTLSKTGYFREILPWWKKILTNAGLAVGAAGLLITAIGSYPFAGFIKEEALQTLDFGIFAAIGNKDAVGLRKALDEKAEILDTTIWEAIFAAIPFINVLAQLKDFYSAARTKLEIDEAGFEAKKAEWEEIPVETEEEKWERIRAEEEARRAAQIIEDEERWARIREETEARRAEAKVAEQEYWDRIIAESKARRAAQKAAEEEYWAQVQAQADIEAAEKRILAEEYWAKVRAEEDARREAEGKYWDEILRGPKKATITITSEPTDADIYIDGEFTFVRTPYTAFLAEGDHTIRVQKKGYRAEEKVIEVLPDEVGEVPFTLEIIPTEEIPAEPYIPYQPTYPKGYETLYPTIQAPAFYEAPAPTIPKELLVNIETTDSKPWKGRIYSIAYQDSRMPDSLPVVLVNDNEEELLRQFLDIFNQINPAKLIGFKLTFDHRYIFNKIMNYRLQSEKWANIEMRDVKQLMDQVKEEFVYFPDKTGTLDDYGKSLLGKGKYGTQKEILKRFLAKDFDYVKAFQERQLEITNGLYQLFRFSSSGSSSSPIPQPPTTTSTPETPLNPVNVPIPQTKNCKECLQINPGNRTECFVCGKSL